MIAYKVQFRLQRIVKEIVDKGVQKYQFLPRARNLVWALLVQALFNDPKIEYYCEEYGKGLVVEANYGELLRDLASKRIRFLVSEATEDEKSRNALAESKFGFLRTKAIFNRCMAIAYDKWGWKKLTF